MAVPKFFEFFEGFLRAVNDDKLHSAKDVRDSLASEMKLSVSDMAEMLPSGKQSTFDNRVAWARFYLDKTGLIETPERGKYRITDLGKKALSSGETIDIEYLGRFDTFKSLKTLVPTNKAYCQAEDKNESPTEILESTYQEISATLASQLMDEIMKLSPKEFESLVVKLLLKMGYGNGIEGAGRVTSPTNDGGIDGIIKEDQLGFNNIYIQAKQWSPQQTVSRPEIQKFVGALQGQQAQKGLFITTSSFSDGAIQYVEKISTSTVKVILIDGTTLTKLMIKNNVGVSIEHTYEIKRIDSDFFSDEL